MNVAVVSPAPRTPRVALLAVLCVLAAAVLWFVNRRLHYLLDVSVASYTDYFWPRRAGLFLHLSAGVIAISVGLLQLWLGLTGRIGVLHRTLGRVYVVSIAVGSVGGFYLALTIPGHLPYSVGLFTLCVAWVVTTAMAIYAIRTRRVEQHREWMLRSYTVTFAFVTYRLVSTVLRQWISVADDPVADDIDTLMAWACWAVPLLLAEPLIQLRAMRRRAARA
jgi:uncharacterized membrane protein